MERQRGEGPSRRALHLQRCRSEQQEGILGFGLARSWLVKAVVLTSSSKLTFLKPSHLPRNSHLPSTLSQLRVTRLPLHPREHLEDSAYLRGPQQNIIQTSTPCHIQYPPHHRPKTASNKQPGSGSAIIHHLLSRSFTHQRGPTLSTCTTPMTRCSLPPPCYRQLPSIFLPPTSRISKFPQGPSVAPEANSIMQTSKPV